MRQSTRASELFHSTLQCLFVSILQRNGNHHAETGTQDLYKMPGQSKAPYKEIIKDRK